MAQIPTPPPSRPGSQAPDPVLKSAEASSESLQSLDALLEQYLHLLDRQQKLQSGLAKQLSSGFLSLAHANYTCPPGRRYGADYYDERMKATRKISIHAGSEVDDSEETPEKQDGADRWHPDQNEYKFNVEKVDNHPAEAKTGDKDVQDEPSTEASQTDASTNDTVTPTSETNEPANQDATGERPATEQTKSVRKKFYSDDPIHWYGILVPPSLRAAQKSFTEAIQSSVPDLAGAIVEMRALEERISQLRANLGIDTSKETKIEK
ncbi:hypothetical protein F1880_008961 [Penicillium rolfsii]|nr:hypothetical protein F1880_008961 [Penicillium rolfsii]